jgi:dynein heavy chain 1
MECVQRNSQEEERLHPGTIRYVIRVCSLGNVLMFSPFSAGLQMKIVAEDKIVENKIVDVLAEWERTRPVQGNIRADTAMNTINVFEAKLNRIQEEYDLVCRAKEALDLDLVRHNRLEPVFEELKDLKAVWTALSGIWSQIAELREMAWATVQPRKLRQHIDGLIASTKDMPNRMRQYSAFEYVQEVLRTHLKANMIISELKSEALKERHWRQLFKVLRVAATINLTQCAAFFLASAL